MSAALHQDANDPDTPILTAAEERERDRLIDNRVMDLMSSASWWVGQFEGQNAITAELPSLLARCASNSLAATSKTINARGAEIIEKAMADKVGSFMLRIAQVIARSEAAAEFERGDLT